MTYETVLEVDNAERLLRPGMTATAEITRERVKDAVLVAQRRAPLLFRRSAPSSRAAACLQRPDAECAASAAGERDTNGKTKPTRCLQARRAGAPSRSTSPSARATASGRAHRKGDVAPDTPLVVDASTSKK